VGKQAEEVCSEQTQDNGVWVSRRCVYCYQAMIERQSERAERRKVDHHSHQGMCVRVCVCVCVCKQRGLFKEGGGGAEHDHD